MLASLQSLAAWSAADRGAVCRAVAERLGLEHQGLLPCAAAPVGVFRHPATGMLLHLLPGDPAFVLGRDGGHPRETTPCPRPIAPFLIGRFPLLRRELAAVARTHEPADDLPVGGISHAAAQALVRAMGLRLPREDEWEHACRATSGTAWWWGDAFDPARAWYLENAGGRPHPVSEHADDPNGFGLVDMAGNVNEWCDGALDVPMEGSSWQEGDPGQVHRGGSFDDPSVVLRSCYRGGTDPAQAFPDLGLRAALSLEQP